MKRHLMLAALLVAVFSIVSVRPASAAVLYAEDFSDATLESNTALTLGAASGGVATFNDTSAGTKARMAVATPFTSNVMTFSFETVAPVTPGPNNEFNDLLIRAGIGTGSDVPSSSDAIFEVILYRDGGNRGTYTNSGDETLFVVVNNQNAALNFNSPVDGSAVSLTPFQYITYLRDNATHAFTLMKVATAMSDRNGADPGVGTISRFAIGNSANAKLGGFAFDNVGVRDEVSFALAIPEPSAATLMACCLLLVCRRRT